ncbi:MAG: hypothetical protein RLZZ383_953 [Pseudomonadota bacterium]|jgi:hypothetical protein
MLETVTVQALAIRDDAAFAAMDVYGRLKGRLARDGYAFRVPARREVLTWEETLLLNVVFWNGATGEDVLEDRAIDADVVAHIGWHHVVRHALGAAADSAEGMLLGEAVASAFDLYAAGRMLALGRDVGFLETQLPAMAEALGNAGWAEAEVDALFERVTADPEATFESLRQLLFDVGSALVRAPDAGAAARVLRAHASHPLAGLLHHYDLATWLLHARSRGADVTPQPEVARIDAWLRAAPSSLDAMAEAWLA